MSDIKDSDGESSGIPHADKLTFVDKMKGQTHKLVDRNSMSGEIVYPRKEYLSDVAAKRQSEYEAAQRAKGTKVSAD